VSVILLRHASAGERETWHGDDRLRPLDERGRKQAEALSEELRARDVQHVVSSPYVRCVETVAPLGLEVVPDERLAEGAPVAETRALLASLADAVACTHGDVVENVLGRSLEKGAGVVLEGDRELEEIPAP
jgi:phosphohistidine phosphatase SixA